MSITSDTITPPAIDAEAVRLAQEFYEGRGWTDGLPVTPVTDRGWPTSSR